MTRWGRSLALALLLTAAIPPVAALAQESAEQVLLDKANYWRLKDRPDFAAQALDQLLEINPKNPDGLFQYGQLSVQLNKLDDARRYLSRLRAVAPNDPHIADLEAEIRAGRIGQTDLSEARQLAQAGRIEEAVKKYQEIFKGPPPPSYAIEYYMTLAGAPGGWDESRQGLEKLAQESPSDIQVKLALAQVYTYREPTRMQGIGMLKDLDKNPVVGLAADNAWRQAVIWLSGSPEAKTALQDYLARYPQDADMQKLLADLKKQPMGGGPGYAAMTKGDLAAAERQFTSELHDHPDDVSALTGLGLVRLRQQRFGEARDLLGRALKAAPDQKAEIGPAYDSAMFWARVDEAKRADAAKNYAAARAILAPLLAHPRADEWGAELVLGDVDAKMGDNAGAEAAYRQALRSHPGNLDALVGLGNALRAQNKTAELAQLTARMTPAERTRFENAQAGGGAAEKLRNEAKEASANGDIPKATAKFQAAIAADPRSPWIRLDYARFLVGQGDTNGAFAAVNPATTGNTPNSILAAAMFDTQQDRWVDALDKINSIPPNQRTEDIRNFRDRVYVRGTIDRAKQLAAAGNTSEARNILVALYADPNVKTDEKREAPFVLIKTLHDYPAALQVTHDVYMRGGPDSVKAGADYAMILLVQGGHDDEAAAVMTQINASGLVNDKNRDDLTKVKITLAVRQADKLRERHEYADAWDQISQLLNDNPDDTSLLLVAGRIYASGGRSKEAMEYFDKAYQQDSGNIDVLRGVIAGAILAHRLSEAQDYLDKAMEGDPQNPWLFYLKAQIAQARGNNVGAIEALRTARTLNQQANETAPGAPSSSTPTSLTPGATPAAPALPANPFRSSQSTLRGMRFAAIDGPATHGKQSTKVWEVCV